MKVRLIILGAFLFCLFSSAVYSNQVTFDLSELVITDGITDRVFLEFDGMRIAVLEDNRSFVMTSTHLPNMARLLTISKRGKITNRKLIWVENEKITISGPIDDAPSVKIAPQSNDQGIADRLFKDRLPFKEADWNLATSQVYLVHFLKNKKFTKRKFLDQLVKEAKEQQQEFWAYQELQAYLTRMDEIGYDSETQIFSYLNAVNRDGEKVRFEHNGEKYLLIDFGFSGCLPCIQSLGDVAGLNEKYQDQLEILNIWNDPKQEAFLNHQREAKSVISWNSLRDEDGAICKAFGINLYPTYILFDQEGKLVKQWSSFPKKIGKFLN